MRASSRLASVLVAALAASCYEPTYPEGLACSTANTCPPGQACDVSRHQCVSAGSPEPADARPGPGGPDASPEEGQADASPPADAAAQLGSLRFKAQPSALGEIAAGAAIAPAIEVEVTDGAGQPVTAAVVVSLGLTGGPGTLAGVTETASQDGVARFSTLTVSAPGSGYRLTATAPGFAAAGTNAFTVNAASVLAVFRGRVVLAERSGLRDAIVADVNGDDLADLVVADEAASAIRVYPGRADHTFGAPASRTLSAGPTRLAAGDLDGDGITDVVAAHIGASSVTVLRGTADGLTVVKTLATLPVPASIAVEDVNANGRPDVIVQSEDSTMMSILPNNTLVGLSISFGSRVDRLYGLDRYGSSVAAGDLNGDGRPDVLIGAYSGMVAIFLQAATPSGSLRDPVAVSLGGHNPCLVLADLDGDGAGDLIGTSAFGNRTGNPVNYRLNRTAAGATALDFEPEKTLATGFPDAGGGTWVAAVDVSGDDRLDLVVSHGSSDGLVVFRASSQQPGTFLPRVSLPGVAGHAEILSVGDLDGDGRDDVVATGPDAVTLFYARRP